MDLNGKQTRHGPVIPVVKSEPLPQWLNPELLSELGQRLGQKYEESLKVQHLKERLRQTPPSADAQFAPIQSVEKVKLAVSHPLPGKMSVQWVLAGSPTVKIAVKEEGWYQVGIGDLMTAGLNPRANPQYLQLFADGKEVPILVKSHKPGRLGVQDTVEFYAMGMDTPSTDTRVYWLMEGAKPGKRLPQYDGQGGQPGPVSFPFITELKERLFSFAALKNGEAENFFGCVVSAQAVDKALTAFHLDPMPPGDAVLEVSLQGMTKGSHRVKVLLNLVEVGEVVFDSQSLGYGKWAFPQGQLLEGENLVTLSSQNGDMDESLIDSIKLTYWLLYTAQDNLLRFSAQGGLGVSVSGFRYPGIRVVDITDPYAPYEVQGRVLVQGSDYSITFGAPGVGVRTLLAFSKEQVKNPGGIAANQPSTWNESRNAHDLVILSHRDFLPALEPLKNLRQSQGLSTGLIDAEDIYDEFSFGNKTPQAIKDFLSHANTKWRQSPRFVLLVGDASMDPRNYLGTGNFDFVPTQLVESAYMETASDDWFADFGGDGLPRMAVGRLPVRTAEEASNIVAKIIGYENLQGSGSWSNLILLVADEKSGFDFEAASRAVGILIPSEMAIQEIFRSHYGSDEEVHGDLLNRMDQGYWLINYIGHGSEEVWGGDLLRSEECQTLANEFRLPLVISMPCLNGYFIDVYTESLAEALLKAKQGGAVAVWGSSGLTEPGGQAILNQEVIRLLFNGESLTLGEAVGRAKAAVSDTDIRRTWILFGDPAMRLYSTPSGRPTSKSR